MFTKTTKLSFLACAFLAACSGSGTDVPGTGPGTEGPGPDSPEPTALEVSGSYTVTSRFDVDLDDLAPGADVLDKLDGLEADPIGEIADLLSASISFDIAGPAIKDALGRIIDQDLASKISGFAADLKAVSASFDMVSALEVSAKDGAVVGMHRPDGMTVTADGKEYSWSFEDGAEAASSAMTVDGAKLGFASHDLAVPYTEMLRMAIDQVLVPNLDSEADTLEEALTNLVSCDDIADELAQDDLLKGLGAPLISGFCTVGMKQFIDQIDEAIDDLIALEVSVRLTGEAQASDTDGDGKADLIDGVWDGQIGEADAMTAIGAAPFRGLRN